VIVMAEPTLAPTQALIRWDPVWHARRELEDRAGLHYPPAARVAELTGSPQAVAEELRLLDLPPEAEVLGPVKIEARAERSDKSAEKSPSGRPAKDPLGRAAAKAAVLAAAQAAALEQTRSPAAADRAAPEVHRALVRVPRPQGADLAARVREAQGVRSARKAEDWVRVRIDPVQLG
jgi:primosomal protein N' (replication factor Y)